MVMVLTLVIVRTLTHIHGVVYLNLGFGYNPKFYTCWLRKGHKLLYAWDCYIVPGLLTHQCYRN